MKRFLLPLSLILAVLFGWSCSVEDIETPKEPQKELTAMQRAEQEVMDLLTQIDTKTRAGSTRKIAQGSEFDIYAKTRSADYATEGLPELFVFNFANEQGFAIATAEEGFPSVLALTDSGSWDQGQTMESIDNPGFALYIDMMYDFLLQERARLVAEALAEGQTTGTRSADMPLTKGDGDYTSYAPWQNATGGGTIMATNWGQSEPYNFYCPYKGVTKAVTGCVATAVAQIMCHHGYPASKDGYTYNWAEMRKRVNGVSESNMITADYQIARLMQQLGLSKHLDMNYGAITSGAYDKNVPSTLKAFGYSNYSSVSSYNIDLIKASLLQNKPVYTRGYSYRSSFIGITVEKWKGHAWVIDAFISQQRTVYQYKNYVYKGIVTQKRDIVHCNWGWDGSHNGSSDGYYESKVFNVNVNPVETGKDQDYYYKHDLAIIDGISR